MEMLRNRTKEIRIGNVWIGGSHPVAIQSMTNTKTEDVAATVEQILALEEAGCEIIRCAVPTMEAALALKEIKKQIHIPLVADIHFDYRLAIAAIENGADKIRINPGNIGSKERVQAVVEKAKEYNVPIRVGVNSGSLEKNLLEKYGGVTAEGIVESALDKVRMIEEMGYDNLVVSIKSSDVLMCVRAHELIAEKCQYPLHVGITESGTVYSGNIKSSVGLGIILHEGIGNTIRVSLTGDPTEEIRTAKLILKTLGMRKGGIEVVSCPTCGRTRIDLIALAGCLVVIPEKIIHEFENRIINIHPSLIPSFCGTGYYGLKVHEKALARGVKVSGATVHFVDEGTDTGPIIAQKAVEIKQGDTPEVLQRRIMEQAEWVIMPKDIDDIANGRIKVEEGKVIYL